MAVVVSSSLVKVKADNDKEEVLLGRRLHDLEKTKADTIVSLHKEKYQLLAQLRAQRAQEIRAIVRESLNQQERKRRHEQRMRAMNPTHAQRRNTQVRGFSKVSVDAEDPTEKKFLELMKENQKMSSFSRSRTMPANTKYRKQGKKDDDESSDDDAVPVNDSEVLVYYPISASGKRVPPHDRHDPRSYIQPLDHLVSSRGKLAVELPSLPQTGLPSYVRLLGRLRDTEFDQYTDGTMALEMRRLRQRRLERMPTQTGHLPVRPRPQKDAPPPPPREPSPITAPDDLQVTSILQRLGSVHGRVLAGKPLRFYLPKDVRMRIGNSDVTAENERLQKLARAEQSATYRSILQRTASFLGNHDNASVAKGNHSGNHGGNHGDSLTEEESMMLRAIQEERRVGGRGVARGNRRGVAQLTKLMDDGKLAQLPQLPEKNPTFVPSPHK